MENALTVVIVPALIGVLATLLTIFLTPPLQQYFWMTRQREELRLRTADEMNVLFSEYITKYIDADNRGERYDPPVAFFQSLRVADVKLKVLFSAETHGVYKQAEVMIAHGTLGPGGTIDGFITAHENALRAMYTELGLSEGLWAHLRRWWRQQRRRGEAK